MINTATGAAANPKKRTVRFDGSGLFRRRNSAANPPYNCTDCTASVYFPSGTPGPNPQTFPNWSTEMVNALRSAPSSGVPLTITVTDRNQAANNTSILNWALTFIPRGPNTSQSPGQNNQSSIAGNGAITHGVECRVTAVQPSW